MVSGMGGGRVGWGDCFFVCGSGFEGSVHVDGTNDVLSSNGL